MPTRGPAELSDRAVAPAAYDVRARRRRTAVILALLAVLCALGAYEVWPPPANAPASTPTTTNGLRLALARPPPVASATASPSTALPSEQQRAPSATLSLSGGFPVTQASTSVMPGDVVSTPPGRPVLIRIDGAGAFSVGLTQTDVSSRPCADCPSGIGTATDLAHRLTLTVTDVTGTPRTVYSGLLVPTGSVLDVSLPGRVGGTRWAGGETHAYRLAIGVPRRLGNDYQGTSADFAFVWRQTAAPESQPVGGGLAYTGAALLAPVLLGLAFLATGVALVNARRAPGGRSTAESSEPLP